MQTSRPVVVIIALAHIVRVAVVVAVAVGIGVVAALAARRRHPVEQLLLSLRQVGEEVRELPDLDKALRVRRRQELGVARVEGDRVDGRAVVRHLERHVGPPLGPLHVVDVQVAIGGGGRKDERARGRPRGAKDGGGARLGHVDGAWLQHVVEPDGRVGRRGEEEVAVEGRELRLIDGAGVRL
eukprot:6840990-Prymnesium_polylepis.1